MLASLHFPAAISSPPGCSVIDEIRALLTRHLPSYAVQSIARLGEGWDNVAYEVNGVL